jgi:hypothetical protein
MWGDVLEPASVDCVICQTKAAMLIAISTTVTTGNRSVGMLSLTGIKAREAYGSAREPPLVYSGHRDSGLGPGNQDKGVQLSRSKLSTAVAAALMIGALALSSMAFGRAAADTGVTIRGDNGDYHGKVLSERAKCQVDRKVVVYKQRGRHQEPTTDKKIGSDISEDAGNHGVWDIGNSGFKHGKFYAKAKRSPGCATGYSKTIKR